MQLKLPFSGIGAGDRAVGLDIGSHSVKLVELKAKPGGFQVLQSVARPLPREALEDEGLVDLFVEKLLAETGLKNHGVYLSVSGQNVLIRRSSLPQMPLAELPGAIKFDVREEVLFPLENASVDFLITGETTQGGAAFYELLAVIAEGNLIHAQIDRARRVGMKLLGITAFPIALWDYDNIREQIKSGKAVCFVDMGAGRTRVYFATDKDLLFFREIPTGGENVTDALMESFPLPNGQSLVLDYDQAERVKIEYGLPGEPAQGNTEEGIPLQDLRERLLSVFNKQAEEIYRSIEYFRNLFKREEISHITLSGGASGLKEASGFLSNILEIKIEPFNPLLQSSPAPPGITEDEAHRVGASLAGAAGLALGRCDKINLLPEEFRPSIKKTLVKAARALAAPMILIGLGLFSWHLRGEVTAQADYLQAHRQELTRLQGVIAKLSAPQKKLALLRTQRDELLREIGKMPVGVENQVDFPTLLEELALRVPPNASLERLEFSGEDDDEESPGASLILKGQVFGDDAEVPAQSSPGASGQIARNREIGWDGVHPPRGGF
ncbi:MAG: pilus assembly protein PilM [Nitrospinaceae bacterium]